MMDEHNADSFAENANVSNPADVQDIVERLRELFKSHKLFLLQDAADEIERLRAALQQSHSAVVEECAKKVEEVWLDGEPYAECADWVRKLSQESAG